MRKFGNVAFLAAVVVTAGCVQTPPPASEQLEVPLPADWDNNTEGDPELQSWNNTFGDPVLSGLVDEAIGQNFQLQAGLARLEQAMALARIEGAGRFPDLALTGGAQRSMSNNLSEPVSRFRSDRYDVGAVASWELDLWGRVRSQARAGRADAAAAGGRS